MIDFTGKKVIIFGGGSVGARKAKYFGNEAVVVVYSRSFHPDFQGIPADLQKTDIPNDVAILRQFVSHSALVIAATSDYELNNTIRSACDLEGIWCNVAAGKQGDVTLPAKFTGERFTVAISTTGSVPAIARLIREQFEEMFPDLDDLIELGEWIRATYRGNRIGLDTYDSVLFQAIRDPMTRKALQSGQEKAREYVLSRFAL